MSVALKSTTESLAQGELRFSPSTLVIGAEVSGIDLREELDAPTVAALHDAIHEYKVLIFRDQDITDEQQVRYTRYFGGVTPGHPISDDGLELHEIKSNVHSIQSANSEYDSRGPTLEQPLRPVGRYRPGRGWHTDITFVANPAAYSFLRGIEIPPVGGDTLWVNTEALYESLSPSFQKFLDGLQAIHTANGNREGRERAPRRDNREQGPFASLHPLVRVHPVTGRKALLLGHFVQAIHGVSAGESDAILSYLETELASRQEFHVRLRWQKNTLVQWDNRATSHVGPIDRKLLKDERIVHRTTAGGELPVGPDGFTSRQLAGELFNVIS